MVAQPPSLPPPFAPDIMRCVAGAARTYHVPRILVLAIIKSESDGNRNVVNVNRNGTIDVGAMQINTIWQQALEIKYRIRSATFHITHNTCYNIQVGTWLLSNEINAALRHGAGFWEGVGNYHSHKPAENRRYQNQVAANMKWLERNTNWSYY